MLELRKIPMQWMPHVLCKTLHPSMSAAIAPGGTGHSNTPLRPITSHTLSSKKLPSTSLAQKTNSSTEYTIVGDDIDPQVLTEPRWKHSPTRSSRDPSSHRTYQQHIQSEGNTASQQTHCQRMILKYYREGTSTVYARTLS